MQKDLVRDRAVSGGARAVLPTDVPELSLDVRMRNYRGSHFISCRGRVFELNSSGWSILMALDGTKNVYEVACVMSKSCRVPVGGALEEVMEFIGVLDSFGVVTNRNSIRKKC
ncbi:PqqD family protein [Nocardiopsis sp. NPDC101807]|uniref:PqqD family protein n=1 Tax=Nocardiopsis sp. NPDC101807 TaxID=3364339 RepID=UPI0037F889F7